MAIEMAQVKIYALDKVLEERRNEISNAVHDAIMLALNYPAEKRFQRFFPMDKANFIYPSDRSENYTIIEISMFEGRSTEAKKRLIMLIFQNLEQHVGITPGDVEISITESPKENWGIRGMPADELTLNYTVEI